MPSAAGNIRSVASRTRDVIDAVVQVGLFNGHSLLESVNSDDLGVQLEFGIPEEIVGLAQTLGTELNRGEYLALRNAGLVTVDQLVAAGPEVLVPILGEEHALRVLEHLI